MFSLEESGTIKDCQEPKARNAYIFNHEPVDPFHVIAKANWEESEFLAARASSTVQTGVSDWVRSNSVPRWIPPARGLLKVNCDTAFHPMSSKGAIAVLLRDDRGRLVDGLALEVVLSSASQGEALAIRLACLMVRSLGLSSVEVEGMPMRQHIGNLPCNWTSYPPPALLAVLSG
ncbi:hypothetical protein LOK49_LG13G00962 [Camellia lanceoleosa]|uniref:Uncharacterized protein n=1 Tax=Camellia lanceoleosa TaxID=1840588 RepID=A0ACC0FF74_9ERIC|nr:hypothetical protein LOK49_LG13G00962 [Camellia lanceoleosa]